jgi:CubicO group peptidase (beta-lactamase class C family)
MKREPFRRQRRGAAEEEAGAARGFTRLLHEELEPLIGKAGTDGVIQKEGATQDRGRRAHFAQDRRRRSAGLGGMNGKEQEEERRGESSHAVRNPALALAAPSFLRAGAGFQYSHARMIPRKFRPLASAIQARIAEGLIPGAVVVVGRARGPVHEAAIGRRALLPRKEPLTARTVFDLASLTKVMVTAPLVVERAVRGEISLLDPLSRHLPETRGTSVGSIPLHLLLTHTAGFVPDNPIEDYAGTKTQLLAAIAREPLASEPGTKFEYSDVGYVLLQLVLERRTRARLDRVAEREIFRPLRLRHTRFGIAESDRKRTAPTTFERGLWLRGRVHDPRARSRALAGVAGHAGVFGTGSEVAQFCEMILLKGRWRGRRVLAEETVRAMTTDQCEGNIGVRRGFGFDIGSPYSSPRGLRFSRNSFGHSGWTGVSLWIDPEADAYVVLLTNAIHPDGHKDLKAFRSEVATLAAEGLGI